MPDPDQPTGLQAAEGASPDDGVGVMAVGTLAWLAALIACLLARDWLAQRDASWWQLTALIGFGMGLIGVTFTRRRARAYRAHRVAGAHSRDDQA